MVRSFEDSCSLGHPQPKDLAVSGWKYAGVNVTKHTIFSSFHFTTGLLASCACGLALPTHMFSTVQISEPDTRIHALAMPPVVLLANLEDERSRGSLADVSYVRHTGKSHSLDPED